MGNQPLHDQDFYAWANERVGLLRAGRLSAADTEHIADEIESIDKTEQRELASRLRVLLLHLLKRQFQPNRRGASWEGSIINTRDELDDLLHDNLSLRTQTAEALGSAYRRAVLDAVAETGLSKTGFPLACPWDYDTVMDADFWPEVAN